MPTPPKLCRRWRCGHKRSQHKRNMFTELVECGVMTCHCDKFLEPIKK